MCCDGLPDKKTEVQQHKRTDHAMEAGVKAGIEGRS